MTGHAPPTHKGEKLPPEPAEEIAMPRKTITQQPAAEAETDTRPAFAPFPGTDAETFIQWKGTTVCMDFHCACGHHGHIDSGFAYFVRCPRCGAVYEMGTQVLARRIPEEEAYDGSTVIADA